MKLVKKLASLLLSAFVVLIVSGFLNLKSIGTGSIINDKTSVFARHTDADECNDVTLIGGRSATDPVLSPATLGRTPGVADSGQLDFDTPTHPYQTCVRTSVSAGTHQVEGWAWNTNLGYVSFSCNGGLNLGGSCGSQNYSSVLFTDGRIRGFAWGDNTGWISLGCEADGMNTGIPCGATTYGVYVAGEADIGVARNGCGPLAAGDLYGFAWTDSVGWINFCGAHVDVTEAASGLRPEIRFESPANVYANGVDAHKIIVEIFDGATKLTDLSGHTVSVEASDPDNINTLRADQVTPCDGGTCPATRYNGALLPNSDPTAWFPWNAAEEAYVAEVKSIAPTGETDDRLSLGGLIVRIDGAPFVLDEITRPAAFPHTFAFEKPVDVTEIASADASGVTTIANSSQEVKIHARRNTEIGLPNNTEITIHTQLYDCATNDAYNFVFDTLGNGNRSDDAQISGTGTFPNIAVMSRVCTNASSALRDVDSLSTLADSPFSKFIYTFIALGRIPQAIETANAVGLRTIVSYTMGITEVRYFSMPVGDGSVRNQAALVRGDVSNYIRDISNLPAANRVRQSIGKNARSKREPYYRAAQKMIRDQNPAILDTGNKKIINATTLGTLANHTRPGSNILYFRRDPNINDEPCSLIFRGEVAGETLLINGNYTVYSEGCDIFIDSDILPATSTSRLAILSFEDLSMPSTRKGGYAYICSTVTDVQLNAILDNSLISYGEADCGGDDKTDDIGDVDPIPIMTSFLTEIFKNQLAWTGTLISDNTYGGALSNPPIGSGGVIALTGDEIKNARWFDVNFLRYARIQPASFGGETNHCWAEGVKLSSALLPANTPADTLNGSSDICNINHPGSGPGDYGIVNFFFSPAPKNQPLLNAVGG